MFKQAYDWAMGPENVLERFFLTPTEVNALRPGLAVDFRDDEGRFVLGVVHSINIADGEVTIKSFPLTESKVSSANPRRFAQPRFISQRQSQNTIPGVGSFVDFNPQPHPGWRTGKIKEIDTSSAQVKVEYRNTHERFSYWTHIDNTDEIAEYFSKSCEPLNPQWMKPDLALVLINSDERTSCQRFDEEIHWYRLRNEVETIRIDIRKYQTPSKYKKILDFYGTVSLLCLAVLCRDLSIVQYLHQRFNVDINARDSPTQSAPLILAAKVGDIRIVKYLVETCNCDIHTTDCNGRGVLEVIKNSSLPRSHLKEVKAYLNRILKPQPSSSRSWFLFLGSNSQPTQTQYQTQITFSRQTQKQELFLKTVRQMTEIKQRYLDAVLEGSSSSMLHVHNLCLQNGLGNIHSGADDFKQGSETLNAAMNIVAESQQKTHGVLENSVSCHVGKAKEIEREVTNFLYRVLQHEEVCDIKCIVSNPDEKTMNQSMGQIMASGHTVDKYIEYIQGNEQQLSVERRNLAINAPSCVETMPVKEEFLYAHMRDGTQMKDPADPKQALVTAERLHREEQESRAKQAQVVESMEVDTEGVPDL